LSPVRAERSAGAGVSKGAGVLAAQELRGAAEFGVDAEQQQLFQ
jgi:hypothetical protein